MEAFLAEKGREGSSGGGGGGVRDLAALHDVGSHPLTLDFACQLASEGVLGAAAGGDRTLSSTTTEQREVRVCTCSFRLVEGGRGDGWPAFCAGDRRSG